jgi:small subunit ribosomal protein S9
MKHKHQITKVVKQAKKAEKKEVNNNNKKVVAAKKLNYPQGQYTEGIGRRKTATARVRIYESAGDFIVNDQLVSDYFANIPMSDAKYNLPFKVTKTDGDFAVTVKVSGSGKSAQMGAIMHGLARALVKFNPELRTFLKPEDLLKRDPRMKETRKPGRGGKARRKRQSPKR